MGDPIDIGSFDNGHIGRFKIAQQIAQKGLVLGHIVSDAYGDPDSIGASNVKYAQEQVRAARSCWEGVLGVSFGSEGNFGIL